MIMQGNTKHLGYRFPENKTIDRRHTIAKASYDALESFKKSGNLLWLTPRYSQKEYYINSVVSPITSTCWRNGL
jgi:hypothetical protein